MISPVIAGNGRSEGNDSRPKQGLQERYFVEEGRQLEKIAVMALNQAKQGSKPLSKDDFTYFETWLAKYRASKPHIATQSFPMDAKTKEDVTAGKEEISKDLVEGIEEVKATGANIDIGENVVACGNGGTDFLVSVGETVRILPGTDDDGTKIEEEESVVDLGTNAVSKVAEDVGFPPLNRTRAAHPISGVDRSVQEAIEPQAHGVDLSSCPADVSAKEDFRSGGQRSYDSGAQIVFDKRPQQDSHVNDPVADSRAGRKEQCVKRGCTKQPSAQSQGAAHELVDDDALSKPNCGQNWASVVAVGPRPKADVPRLN
ncbi:hypothetical protein U1Q18_037905, partial [Sarracenia purpurea var. burkii]